MNAPRTTTRPASTAKRGLCVLLAVGPLATLWALAHPAVTSGWITASMLPWAMAGALVLWSPLPISLPAVLMADARDAALPHLRGFTGNLRRAALLMGHLGWSPRSTVRSEARASLAGFAGAMLWAAVLAAGV